MQTVVAPDWELSVERGPDCLLVRARCTHDDMLSTPPLADELWSLLERHVTYRLILELDGLELLRSYLLGQLVLLDRRIRQHHGVMRLCGLSPQNQKVLAVHRLDDRFIPYRDIEDAVVGCHPRRPR